MLYEKNLGQNFRRQNFEQVLVMEMRYRHLINYNYIVVEAGGSNAVIVDPAWEMHKIESVIEERRLTLKAVLITHSHPDHLNLAEEVAEKYQCSICMSEEEIAFSGFRSKWLVPVKEGSFSVARISINAILTPGHTPGCICYQIGFSLFSGDVLFAEGCGVCPDIQSAYKMYQSLNRLKQDIPPETRIFPGHSYGKPPGQIFKNVLKDNIYLQFDSPEPFISFRMRKKLSPSDIFNFR